MPAYTPQPIARPPASLGTSGIHHVPDVSPSLDPAIFGQVEPKDTTRQLAVKALTIARQQALAACHSARSIHSDPTIHAVEKHRRAGAGAAAALMPTLEPLEKARAVYEKRISELAILSGPKVELSDVRAVEIRTKLQGLPADKRFAAISKAIARGDDSTVAAVTGADRILTDFLSDLEVERIRGAWQLARHPDEVILLKQRESDLDHLERAGKILISYGHACAGPSVVAQQATRAPASPYGSLSTGGVNGAAERAKAFR